MEETTPLLRGGHAVPPATKSRLQVRKPRTVILLLSCMVFCVSCSGTMGNVPLTQLLEDDICRRYYDGGAKEAGASPIDERLCKTDAVQSKLAYLNGWLSMLEAIVGEFLLFPPTSMFLEC